MKSYNSPWGFNLFLPFPVTRLRPRLPFILSFSLFCQLWRMKKSMMKDEEVESLNRSSSSSIGSRRWEIKGASIVQLQMKRKNMWFRQIGVHHALPLSKVFNSSSASSLHWLHILQGSFFIIIDTGTRMGEGGLDRRRKRLKP